LRKRFIGNRVPARAGNKGCIVGAVVEAEKEASVKDENKPEKTHKAKRNPSPGGIAHHPSTFRKAGADVIFTGPGSTNYTVTGTTDGGDALLTNVEVTVIFWGDYWNVTVPAPNVSVGNYYTAFTGVVTGPYMTRLNQYRGLGPGSMLGQYIVPSGKNASNVTMPANGYTDADVEYMLSNFFQNNPTVAPANGHSRFYAVVSPPGLNNSLSFGGQHQHNTYNGIGYVYAWVNGNDSLSDVAVFGHELVEGCSNPTLRDGSSSGNGIKAPGTDSSGSPVQDGSDEIGDACEQGSGFVTVWVNQLQCSMQGYWSEADNACVLPLGTVTLLMNKNTFGKDEVQEAINNAGPGATQAIFSNAFWVALDEYSQNTFTSFNITAPTPTFSDLLGNPLTIPGVRIQLTPSTPSAPNPVLEAPGDNTTIQRMRWSYDVVFAIPLQPAFPSQYLLNANFLMDGNQPPGGTQGHSQDVVNFDLLAGADPRFSNIDVEDSSAVSYLSQDLRVCTVTAGHSALPNDPNVPVFSAGESAYTYIQTLLAYLNNSTAYTLPVPPTSPDPLNGLTNQSGYETGLTSVVALDSNGNQNYNFAIARVRMTSNIQGTQGEALNTRVFFRLWTAPSYDTDYNPNTTYPSNLGTTPGSPDYNFPISPKPSGNLTDPSGQNLQTTPFYATNGGASDYDPSFNTPSLNNNIQTIAIPTVPGQDSVWTYYGCFLDVYAASNNALYPGTHHCLVAQIAYDSAPIPYSSSTTTTTGNCDKLAQRNLQITKSGNPGPASTHRVPQAFDTRPSLSFRNAAGRKTGIPDEIMIDWGNTPPGSTAYIYWPQVLASHVIQLASQLYVTHFLSAADANTISCKTVKGATYIPVPSATNQNFAGLFTVDLPIGITAGEVFTIVVRRLTTKTVPGVANATIKAASARSSSPKPVRMVTGAFLVTIPVANEADLLIGDENTLAVMKWRLQEMSPQYRWYPVVKRYIGYLSARVDASGGNAGSILPSPVGLPVSTKKCPHPVQQKHCTGKVKEVVFDCFGDFEGFVMECCRCGDCSFKSRERAIGELLLKACNIRWTITVCSDEPGDKICGITVLS
jgi:hypothetical protein